MSNARFKRPELPRREPIRHWTGVFGTAPNSVSSAPPPAAEAPAPERETVARGVDMGYRVLDEYLRQGQSFARTVAGARPFGSGNGSAGPQLTEQLARSTLDWLATWFDYMQTMSASDAARRPAPREVGGFDIEPPLQPAAARPAAEAAQTNGHHVTGRPLISLDVASKQRTEVTIDLKPDSLGRSLRAHDLRAADPDLPRIAGVVIEAQPQDERLVVRIQVPDDQPAAVYSGLIIDETTHLPRGSVTLRVVAPAQG